MQHDIRRTYIQMATAALPVLALNLLSYGLFGFDVIPANDLEGYDIALTMMGVSFLVLGAAIASFRASISRLRRRLNSHAFDHIMHKRIAPALFFAFGFIVGIMLHAGGGETNPMAIGELELMRQATAMTMTLFLGVAATIAIKTQIPAR